MNWPHIHLALNHVPVLGTIFLSLLLVAGMWRRSDEIKRLSLQGLLLLAAVSIPIKFTGDFAHESLAKDPTIEAPLVSKHEQTADQATTGVFVLGLIALAGLIASRKQKPIPNWAATASLIAALLTFALMIRTASTGGKIRHPEIREGAVK